MTKTVIPIITTVAITLLTTTSFADPLPKGSVKLTKSEATALYAGRTAKWVSGSDKDAYAYFAPNGVIYMYGPKKDWYGEGRWTVAGNKVCNTLTWHGKDGKSGKADGNCWTWYRSPDGKLWDLWSGERDKKNGWWDKEMTKFSRGDRVTKTYNALKAKF